MGKDDITEEGLASIKRMLTKEAEMNYGDLCRDLTLAPEWIRSILTSILNSIQK